MPGSVHNKPTSQSEEVKFILIATQPLFSASLGLVSAAAAGIKSEPSCWSAYSAAAAYSPYHAGYAAAAMAAMAAAVFSLLVFCVASRFVSYWTTAAKGKREERGEEGREPSLPLFGVSPNLFVGSSEKKLPETISPFPNFLLLSLRSFQD